MLSDTEQDAERKTQFLQVSDWVHNSTQRPCFHGGMLSNVSLEMGILSAKNCETAQNLTGTLASCWEAAQWRKEHSPRSGKTWGLAAARHARISHLISPHLDFHIYKMMALDTIKDICVVFPQQRAKGSETSKHGDEWFFKCYWVERSHTWHTNIRMTEHGSRAQNVFTHTDLLFVNHHANVHNIMLAELNFSSWKQDNYVHLQL